MGLGGRGHRDVHLIAEPVGLDHLFSLFCLEAIIGGVALFRLVVDRAGPGWRMVAGNSYGIYYVHPLILYPLAYILVSVEAPSIAKATVLVVVTFLASLAISALVLTCSRSGSRRLRRCSRARAFRLWQDRHDENLYLGQAA